MPWGRVQKDDSSFVLEVSQAVIIFENIGFMLYILKIDAAVPAFSGAECAHPVMPDAPAGGKYLFALPRYRCLLSILPSSSGLPSCLARSNDI